MPLDAYKLASAYLKLWKALDVYFDGHQWLELVPEDSSSTANEINELFNADLSFADDPKRFRDEIARTLLFLKQEPKNTRWISEAEVLRTYFQNQAIRFAGDIVLTMEKPA